MTLNKEWKYTFSSVVGTSHEDKKIPCQDFSLCKVFINKNEEEVLVATVSDGAGSAKFSNQGSSLACTLFVEEVTKSLSNGKLVKDFNKSFFEDWLESFQQEVKSLADEIGYPVRDFACTFLAAIVGNDYAAFFQVGDGAIIVLDAELDEDKYVWIFWPAKGEFENTTFFITDPMVKKNVQYDYLAGKIDEIALFTDGIQHLTLHYQTQTVYDPFFKPMFAAIRKLNIIDQEALNNSLANFLSSNRINEKTDDDKTLLLATRRGVEVNGKE